MDRRPEIWRKDAEGDSVALLDIPAALRRRSFDIDVTLVVDVLPRATEPWHELAVDIDGQRQWSRRIASHLPGPTDGLDYHCRIALEVGDAVRIRAVAAARAVRIRQLMIEAREEG
jgi:hypothetical protein